MKKHYKAVNLPMLDWLMFGGWRSIVVERQALQDLIDIEERMQVLAPIGDDNRRGLWIYVHRGLPSVWYANGYYPYGHSNLRFRTYNEAVLMALQIM